MPSGNSLRTFDIVNRIVKNRYEYLARNNDKELKEIAVYEALKASKEKTMNSDSNNNSNHNDVTAQ